MRCSLLISPPSVGLRASGSLEHPAEGERIRVDRVGPNPLRACPACGWIGSTRALRIGEFLALRWLDIDLGAGQFTVRRTARTYSGRGTVYSDPKTAHGRRTIELSAKIIDLLQRHRVKQHEERLQLGPIWTNNDLVFPSRVGTPWDAKNFYRDYRALVDTRSGIARPNEINVHTLRHTAATIWIKAGVEIFTVSPRLGHSDAAFTMNRYGHLVPGMQGTAAQALDHLFA